MYYTLGMTGTEDFKEGMGVTYQSHENAPKEDGTVVRVTDTYVFVHYTGDPHGNSKATRPEDLRRNWTSSTT